MKKIDVGIIGLGYWGPNLLRNFLAHDGFNVRWVCDRNQRKCAAALAQDSQIKVTSNVTDLLLDPSIEVIVIATQASTHYELCRDALLHNKHVFVEKPFVLSSRQAEHLCEMSVAASRKLFVDHTFLYSSGYRKLREIIRSGKLGRILRISSRRCDFGRFQKDANVIWHLAYHDIYLLSDLLAATPQQAKCSGSSIIYPGVCDQVVAALSYADGLRATIVWDMYFPRKIREFVVECERGIIVWDETAQDRLLIVDRYAAVAQSSDLVTYLGDGSVMPVEIDRRETLGVVIEAFHLYLTSQLPSASNCHTALDTVRVIEQVEKSL